MMDSMENTPNYVLHTTERIRVLADPKAAKVRKAVLAVLIVLAVGSFFFGENLFGELSVMAQVVLIGLVFGVLFSRKTKFEEFPLELRFFDDFIEINKPKVPYDNGKVQREYFKFRYADNPTFTYDPRAQYMTIKGMVHGEFYIYAKDGSLPDKPNRVRDVVGLCYFYTDPGIVEEIEGHSPVKVLVTGSHS